MAIDEARVTTVETTSLDHQGRNGHSPIMVTVDEAEVAIAVHTQDRREKNRQVAGRNRTEAKASIHRDPTAEFNNHRLVHFMKLKTKMTTMLLTTIASLKKGHHGHHDVHNRTIPRITAIKVRGVRRRVIASKTIKLSTTTSNMIHLEKKIFPDQH